MHPNTYTIRWRGKNEGPYSADQIVSMLKGRQIGLTHQVNINNQWVSIQEFQSIIKQQLEDQKAQEEAAALAAAAKIAEAEKAKAEAARENAIAKQGRIRAGLTSAAGATQEGDSDGWSGGSLLSAAGGVAVAGIILFLVLALVFEKEPFSGWWDQMFSGGGTISSLDNEEEVGKAVGLVFNAWNVIDENGVQKEEYNLPFWHTAAQFERLPDEVKESVRRVVTIGGNKFYIEYILGSAGSCFLVTPDGYAITNRHVVDEFDRITKAEDKRDELKERLDLEKADPILLVFFGGKEHKASVEYIHPKIDLAIIKIEGISDAPCFSLSDSDEIKRGKKVIVLGFPGAATDKLPGEEGEAALRATGKKIKDYLPSIAFNYVQTPGEISSPQDRSIGRLILHNAVINHGNSGGPLVDERAKVLGINTFGITSKGKQGTFMSVQMKQLREEIDRHIPSVKWR